MRKEVSYDEEEIQTIQSRTSADGKHWGGYDCAVLQNWVQLRRESSNDVSVTILWKTLWHRRHCGTPTEQKSMARGIQFWAMALVDDRLFLAESSPSFS